MSANHKSAPLTKKKVMRYLEENRKRTLALLAPLDDDDLTRQYSPLMSPLVWDLAHIGYFEELWVSRRIGGRPALIAANDDFYDAFNHGRDERADLPILTPVQARRYLEAVREMTLATLETIDFDDRDPLLADGFIFTNLIQHEQQHRETMLATLQLRDAEYPLPDPQTFADTYDLDHPPAGGGTAVTEVELPGGRFQMGTDTGLWAYDNEKPAHETEVAPFAIDAAPVTNGEFAEFIADGGYDDERHWSAEGWQWRQAENAGAPLFWSLGDSGNFVRRRFGTTEAIPANQPVQHVSWFEADAYARWAGKRLPTEVEWEFAAVGGPAQTRWPWGNDRIGPARVNIGARRFAPATVGDLPRGATVDGIGHLVGDVWEWTSSGFTGYPGFEAFPYREYSEVFFGGNYRVLRGGSWATEGESIRSTFRNWDHPERRQIFAGFRCARDV